MIEKLIEYFAPLYALKREYARQTLHKVRSSTYAAAKTNRMIGSWTPGNDTVNNIIAASSADVRARVRQLVRDFPYFSNAANRIVDFSVGPGIQFQSKAKLRDGGLDKVSIQKVEDCFNWWAEDCDYAGKLHFYEIMRLAKRQDAECGEFLVVKRYSQKNRYLPYTLQIIEPDWLTTLNDRDPDIVQGIEFDLITGEVIAYHVLNPECNGYSSYKPTRIPASEVIHGFESLRPGQRRGISPFTAGVLLANDLNDYLDAEVDAAKMAAKYLAFVKSPTLGARQLNLSAESTGESLQYIDEMENAIIEYLNPGEEITLASNPRPGNIEPFVKLVVQMLSISTGVPYELLSGDYKGVNYSTLRSSRNDFKQCLLSITSRHIRQFCNPAIAPFFDSAIINGKLSLPGYFKDFSRYQRTEWQPPGLASVDPLRETKAAIDAIAQKLKSPQEIIRERGRDPEEVLKEIAQWKEWIDDYGLQPEEVSTAMANNPGKVEQQDNRKTNAK